MRLAKSDRREIVWLLTVAIVAAAIGISCSSNSVSSLKTGSWITNSVYRVQSGNCWYVLYYSGGICHAADCPNH